MEQIMYTLEQLQEAGGKLWEKNGMRRVYFNNLHELIGLEFETYNSGNISSATWKGEHTSNADARRTLDGIGKIWYDLNTNELCGRPNEGCRPDYRHYHDDAKEALIAKLDAIAKDV